VGSHAFAYFAFVLAAAALRWGLAATVANGSLVLVIGLVQNSWAASGVGPLAFEVDMLLLPVSYITCGITVLFGTLAERLHRARREAMAIATLSSSVSRMPRLRDAVAHTLEAVTRLMGAARVTLVVEETYTGSRSAWHADRRSGQPLTWEPFQTSGAAADWLPPARDPGACEFRRTSHALPPLLAISLTPQTVTACPELSIPAGVLAAHWTRLIALPFENRDAWAGHLYVMDPTASPGGESRLRFLADLVQQITPGLLNLYLLRWLRSRAGSLERGRISRELHDTVHQSLAGIEMRLDVLRRENAVTSPYLAADLAQIQTLVKDESLQLRHLMERLRPDDVDADGLRGTLAELVNRFSRESGVQARLDWMVARVDLPPRRCSHVVRIVQEALINVRRHSGASCTLIRVEADAAGWRLLIEDNGCGLGFTGRVTARELELQPRGPRVIRERAAALGGSVAMESSPTGTRLEITFPGQEIH
jgi:signal transduction histidine kinase